MNNNSLLREITSKDNYATLHAKFLEDAAVNPANAIYWKADEIMEAQAFHELVLNLNDAVSECKTDVETLAQMKKMLRRSQADLVDRASQADNKDNWLSTCDYRKVKALARFVKVLDEAIRFSEM